MIRFLMIFLFTILALCSEESKLHFLVHPLQGTDPSESREIQSGISRFVLSKYSDRYRVFDPEVTASLMNSLRREEISTCSDLSCERELDFRLQISEKIIPILQKKNEDIQLRLLLYRIGEGGFEKVREIDRTFPADQKSYYTKELTRALLDPNHEIREPQSSSFETTEQTLPEEDLNLSTNDSFDSTPDFDPLIPFVPLETMLPPISREEKVRLALSEEKCQSRADALDYQSSIKCFQDLSREYLNLNVRTSSEESNRITKIQEDLEKEFRIFKENKKGVYQDFLSHQLVRHKLSKKSKKVFFLKESARSIKSLHPEAQEMKSWKTQDEDLNQNFQKLLSSIPPEIFSEEESDLLDKPELTPEKKKKAIRKSLFLPGSGHVYLEPDSNRSKLLFYSGIGFTGLTLLSGLVYYKEQQTYNHYRPVFGSAGTLFPLREQSVLFYLDQTEFNSVRQRVDSSVRTFNLSIGLFLGFHLFALWDLSSLNPVPSGTVSEGWNLEIGNYSYFNQQRNEVRTQAEYIHVF
ncbi:MAG: hypothetical protein KDK54_22065 [Leptospiraceae bacterium]|nr:hypothetical protein [Leptospiraceae bacterium]